jgi:hypothetical protein
MVGDSGSFFEWVVSGIGREGAAAHEVRVMFHCMSRYISLAVSAVVVLLYMAADMRWSGV